MPRVLGHATHYREEKETPAIKIAGIRPRGVVDVMTPQNVDRALVDMPISVTVVYVPASKVSTTANVTPDTLLASGGKSATADVPPEGGPVTVRVPGVVPDDYDVQLILNYPDAPKAPEEPPAS